MKTLNSFFLACNIPLFTFVSAVYLLFFQAAIWEMEERQLHERHQLAKRQLKDLFFLQRHQMLVHHEKELEHLKRMMDRKEEELIKNQTQERKALPKRIRQEMKAREMMFRESMRISTTNLHETLKPVEEKDRLKKVCTADCLHFHYVQFSQFY